MGMIITLTAILIGLYLVLKTKTPQGDLGFKQLADPLTKTFTNFVTALQGK